ncbi:MAG: nitroreductase family protein [Caldilineaceae bacterium]|nr:nitroreductase family protein [Caldilineaceae bacterium]
MLTAFIQRFFHHRCRPLLQQWAAQSPYRSTLYYTVFSRAFGREQQAFLYGRQKYQQQCQRPQPGQRYRLRRNIHRLEKGLLASPQRKLFALDYIDETVADYSRSRQAMVDPQEAIQDNELIWAHDVLAAYFQVVEHHPSIEQARQQFARLSRANHSEPTRVRAIPYQRNLQEPSPVTYAAFMALAKRRRAVRHYLPQPVPRALLDQAITAAAQSPSACNRQPFRFIVLDDPTLIAKAARLTIGIDTNQSIPVLVIVIGCQRAYQEERDRHLIYVDSALAAMTFMLALETLELSSCPIHWPDIEAREQAMARLLRLEADERPILLIAVGYPDPAGAVAFSQKKTLDQLRKYSSV